MNGKDKAAVLAVTLCLSAGITAAFPVKASAEWAENGGSYSYTDDRGKQLKGWQMIDGQRYYFDKKGVALTGWHKLGDSKYYFIPDKKGAMARKWQTVGGKRYYFGTDGKMRTGWSKISGKRYYFGKDGAMVTGMAEINGKRYEFSEKGEYIGKVKQTVYFSAKFDDTKKLLAEKYDALYNNKEKTVIYAVTSGKATADLYFFNENGLMMYGSVSQEPSYMVSFEKILTKAGFEKQFADSSGLGDIYSNGSSTALLYTGDEYAMYLMLSAELSKQIAEGDTSSYRTMMSGLTTIDFS